LVQQIFIVRCRRGQIVDYSLAPAVQATRDRDWVRFDEAEFGVAPGQAAVAYEGTRLLGGGWIAETRSAQQSVDAAAA